MNSAPKEPVEFDDVDFDNLLYQALELREKIIERKLREHSQGIDTTDLQQRILQNIKKEQRKNRNVKWARAALDLYKNAASVLVLAFLAAAFMFGTVEAARETVLSWISGVNEERFRLNESALKYSEPDVFLTMQFPEEWNDFYAPSYLPERFRLVTSYGGDFQKTMAYQNDLGQGVVFLQGERMETIIAGDNEEVMTGEIDISGYSARSTTKGDQVSLYWITEDRAFSLRGNIGLAELSGIAESLRKIK